MKLWRGGTAALFHDGEDKTIREGQRHKARPSQAPVEAGEVWANTQNVKKIAKSAITVYRRIAGMSQPLARGTWWASVLLPRLAAWHLVSPSAYTFPYLVVFYLLSVSSSFTHQPPHIDHGLRRELIRGVGVMVLFQDGTSPGRRGDIKSATTLFPCEETREIHEI